MGLCLSLWLVKNFIEINGPTSTCPAETTQFPSTVRLPENAANTQIKTLLLSLLYFRNESLGPNVALTPTFVGPQASYGVATH